MQVWILNTGGKAETRRRKKNGKILLHGNDGESAELKRVKRMDGGRRMGCVRTYIWHFMYGLQKKVVQIEKENIGSENIISMGSEDGRRLEAGKLG